MRIAIRVTAEGKKRGNHFAAMIVFHVKMERFQIRWVGLDIIQIAFIQYIACVLLCESGCG